MKIPIKHVHSDGFGAAPNNNWNKDPFFNFDSSTQNSNFNNNMQMDFMNNDFNSFPSSQTQTQTQSTQNQSQNGSAPVSSSYIKRRQYTTSSTSSNTQGNNNNTDNDIVSDNNENFEVKVQVERDYNPEDLTVRTADGWVFIEGKQEKKGEGDGQTFSMKKFRKQYQLPYNVKAESLKCAFKDNQLTISAPKMVEARN